MLAPAAAAEVSRRLVDRKILGGLDVGADYPELLGGAAGSAGGPAAALSFAVTEKRTRAEIDRLVAALGEVK